MRHVTYVISKLLKLSTNVRPCLKRDLKLTRISLSGAGAADAAGTVVVALVVVIDVHALIVIVLVDAVDTVDAVDVRFVRDPGAGTGVKVRR